MAGKELNPGVKTALELGPVVIYLLAYFWFKDRPVTFGGEEYSGLVVAMAVFVPLSVLGLLISWALTGTASRMAVFTTLMVMIFGGLTIWMNDETFAMMRPTFVYSFFAVVLGIGLWGLGRSWLQFLMGSLVPLSDRGWWLFTRNWIFFFVFMAVFNEFVWRVLGETAWVWLDTVGQFLLTLVFLATQAPILMRHGTGEEEKEN